MFLVVKRFIKNINGDIVMDFILIDFEFIWVIGIVFEVDLVEDDYKLKICVYFDKLLQFIDEIVSGLCYIIYLNCLFNLICFRVLFGILYDIQINKDFYFIIDVL